MLILKLPKGFNQADQLKRLNKCLQCVLILLSVGKGMLEASTHVPIQTALSTDVINPCRGFYKWRGVEAAPIKSIDHYDRYNWSDIEVAKGVYDFSKIELEAEAARTDADGKGKLIFGVRCVVSGTTRAYPLYLDTLMAHEWYSNAKNCWVPDWNDPNFLKRVDSLCAALGRKYNNDPRIAMVEIRTYGNWGEWHLSGFETPPLGAVTIRDSTIRRIIDAHVRAFPDKQIIMMSDNDVGLQYAMQKTGLKFPIGWRRDSWCNSHFREIEKKSAWSLASNRWKVAPVIIESFSCNGVTHALGPLQVIDYHISAIGNGNWCNWSSLTKSAQDSMFQSARISGYRFSVDKLTISDTIVVGNSFSILSTWTNRNVAPVYHPWQVKYQLRTTGNAIVFEHTSKVDLRTLLPTYNYSTKTNSPVTFIDTITLSQQLTKGTYNIHIVISDPENYYATMNLAINGRENDGSYRLGNVYVSNNSTKISSDRQQFLKSSANNHNDPRFTLSGRLISNTLLKKSKKIKGRLISGVK